MHSYMGIDNNRNCATEHMKDERKGREQRGTGVRAEDSAHELDTRGQCYQTKHSAVKTVTAMPHHMRPKFKEDESLDIERHTLCRCDNRECIEVRKATMLYDNCRPKCTYGNHCKQRDIQKHISLFVQHVLIMITPFH